MIGHVAGKVDSSLVIAKSHVAPMKYTSVPKLGLAAAVVLTKMSVLVKMELGFANNMEYY